MSTAFRRISGFVCGILVCGIVFGGAGTAWSMRIGVLPAADTLALYVADEEKLFADAGLSVELVPFQSALEQAAAVRSGALEGYFGDIINVLLLHDSGMPQRIVATTSYSSPDARFFGVAVPPQSKAHYMTDLKGGTIAVGRATIVDYLLDAMLEKEKLPSALAEHLDIKQIPVRMQMLLAGKVDAAVLPEPLLSLVEKQGARVILDNRKLNMPLAVVAFNQANANPEDTQAFREVLAEAMHRINEHPETYRRMMEEKKLLPKEAAASYRMIVFDPAHTPSELPSSEDIAQVAKWMMKNKMLRQMPEYTDIVDVTDLD